MTCWSERRSFRRSAASPFRQALNDLVRAGLAKAESAAPPRKPFKIKPRHMGLFPGLSYDNIETLLEIGEGPLHR